VVEDTRKMYRFEDWSKTQLRAKTREAMCKLLEPTNLHYLHAKKLEHAVFCHLENECTEKYGVEPFSSDVTFGQFKERYVDVMNEVFGSIRQMGFEKTYEDVIENKLHWKMSSYYPFYDNERRIVMNITKPLEVEEGVFTCPKCKGKRTHHYSRQVRSADEPATTFITCADKACGYNWKIN